VKSKFMTLRVRDILWGFFYALTPIAIPIGKIFSSGHFPSGEVWYSSSMQSIPVITVYLVVHFFKNSAGVVGPEN
jgi:hypothetical protein